ncbi:MAG: hypothetical protein ACI4F3_08955 [Enterocloster sp.]
MTIKEEAKKEREKLSRMNWKDKIWYVWEYYKFHILALFLGVCVLYVLVTAVYRQTFTVRLSMAIINDQALNDSSTDSFEESLHRELGYGKKELIDISGNLYISSNKDEMSQFDIANQAKISALIATGLDIMITDRTAIEYYGAMNGFADLRELLPEELYSRLEDSILWVENENGEQIPAAISLEDTAFAAETGVALNPAYIGIIKNAPHKEDALRTVQYLFR